MALASRSYHHDGVDLGFDDAKRATTWAFADIVGKGGRVRTVPVPLWVREAILSWTSAAKVSSGRIFPDDREG